MANIKTVVEVNMSQEDDKEQFEQFYLLHWGLTYTIMQLNEGATPVQYTVGICQHINTGQINIFYPGQIRVVGKEVKK
jgi:hypothetical protein